MGDFDQVFRRLDALIPTARRGAIAGLVGAAPSVQASAQATTAYRGMSGATRDSTVAFVVADERPNPPEPDAAFANAARDLSGFVGHAGNPLSEPAGDVPADAIRVVLTSMTDYVEALEADHAGQKAFLGPTMQAQAPRLTRAAARGIAAELDRG